MAPGILVFGGGGAIGGAVLARFGALGWRCGATSRRGVAGGESVRWMRCDPAAGLLDLAAGAPYDAVCWAQGANATDSVFDVDPQRNLDLYRANCLFVVETLRRLLDSGWLAPAARLVVVSSVWQEVARQDKLSYTMTKAALGGLVRSAAADLAARGMLINAVLPSALETPMTRANLDDGQLSRLAGFTGFDRLSTLDEVVAMVEFLLSARNTGVTGQSIAVDLGMSLVRRV